MTKTMKRYQQMSINDINAVIDRLNAALERPNVANRAQVVGWLIEAWDALHVAQGVA